MDGEAPAHALRDALRLNRPAFPCRADKRPACPHGFKDATADPDKLRELWRQFPGPLVGVPTGTVSGLFVIDIDCAKHDEANDWLERYSPYLPDTRQHATKSGGWHLLFKHRHGLKSSAGKLAIGVDTRGEGGYIIWWPFHLGLLAPHKLDRPLAELPDELAEHLASKPEPRAPVTSPRRLRCDSDLHPIIRVIAGAREGERNNAAFWAACRLAEHVREGSISSADMVAIVIESAGRAGLSEHEARQVARSAWRTTWGRP